jgi:hypothetical protein
VQEQPPRPCQSGAAPPAVSIVAKTTEYMEPFLPVG